MHTTISQYDLLQVFPLFLFQYLVVRSVVLIGETLRGNSRETLQ